MLSLPTWFWYFLIVLSFPSVSDMCMTSLCCFISSDLCGLFHPAVSGLYCLFHPVSNLYCLFHPVSKLSFLIHPVSDPCCLYRPVFFKSLLLFLACLWSVLSFPDCVLSVLFFLKSCVGIVLSFPTQFLWVLSFPRLFLSCVIFFSLVRHRNVGQPDPDLSPGDVSLCSPCTDILLCLGQALVWVVWCTFYGVITIHNKNCFSVIGKGAGVPIYLYTTCAIS